MKVLANENDRINTTHLQFYIDYSDAGWSHLNIQTLTTVILGGAI